jgi:hypothetical protein
MFSKTTVDSSKHLKRVNELYSIKYANMIFCLMSIVAFYG